jgi:hypothetical protein
MPLPPASGTDPVPTSNSFWNESMIRRLRMYGMKSTDDQPRRVLHIEYAAAVHLESGVELAVG